MGRAKRTPGPWKATAQHGAGHDARFYVHHESPGNHGGYFCVVETLHSTAEAIATAEANARLIAAAPDMRDALEPFANLALYGDLVAKMSETLRPFEREAFVAAFHAARAAVAKAEA